MTGLIVYRSWKTKKYFLVFFLMFFSWVSTVFSSNNCLVYFFNTGVDLNNANNGSGYRNLKESLRRCGYRAVWTHKFNNLGTFNCLLCHNFYSAGRIGALKGYPKNKLVLFMWEPPTVLQGMYQKSVHDCFGKVYTWDDSLVDNVKYFKFYYPLGRSRVTSQISFDEKKLAVMMNRNKNSGYHLSLYEERKNVVRFFERNHYEDFDFYGYGWEKAGFKNYRGSVRSKLDCIKNYKFCYAYENTRDIDGYVTEKIFDAFRAGVVPIYWGARNITEYVPKECFIDRRDFENNEELYQFLKNMSQEEHAVYLENIDRFLCSDAALLFSQEYYENLLLEAINPGYDKKSVLTESQYETVKKVEKYLSKKGL